MTLSQPLPRVAISPSQGYSGQSDPAAPWSCQSREGRGEGLGRRNTSGSGTLAWGGEGLRGPSPRGPLPSLVWD